VEIIGTKWKEDVAEKYLVEKQCVLMFILSYK
jgi:hypothetical protein